MQYRPQQLSRKSTTSALLLKVVLLVLLAFIAEPQAAAGTPDATTITVDATTSLTDAIKQAAEDPRDNRIIFDIATVKLTTTLIITTTAGHDIIDGSAFTQGVTIDGSKCNDAALIIVDQSSITATNIAFVGGKQRTVLVKDDAQLTLKSCTIAKANGPGIAMFNHAQATLHSCTISHNATHGVELHGQSSVTATNTSLANNAQSGIAAFDNTQYRATQCTFDNNGDWNIVLADHSKANCDRCDLHHATFANADISGNATLNAQNCTLTNGKRFGLFATADATITLINTAVTHNQGRGVELQGRAAITLDHTQIENNSDYGLIAFGDADVVARSTTFDNNNAHGASLRDRASAQFNNCRFANNRYSGVGCLDASDGGNVLISKCTFSNNQMRPIYRGPLHIDPIVPTPIAVHSRSVDCIAEPSAIVELYLDRNGQAMQYLRSTYADRAGRFRVDTAEIPQGYVMTAASISNGSTSEFNVIAANDSPDVTCALLSRTGPLSDESKPISAGALLRRWKSGTHVTFHVENPPTDAAKRYVTFLTQCIPQWTNNAVSADVRIGNERPSRIDARYNAVTIPIRYDDPDTEPLVGRGGITYMKWDANGYFLEPMRIILARGKADNADCPRVLAHEIGHTLGLCHVRVGLLSRMQGAAEPGEEFINDFSPMLTYYDVLALQTLYDARTPKAATLQHLADRGVIPAITNPKVATANDTDATPTFSPRLLNAVTPK